MDQITGASVRIIPYTKGEPARLVATAEVLWHDLGIKIVGITIWRWRSGKGYSVVLPSRRLSGEWFQYLRPIADDADASLDWLEDQILEAFEASYYGPQSTRREEVQ